MKFIWHKKDNSLSLKPITQVYGVCFDRAGNVLIMRTPGKSWNIPGGKPELDATPEVTLKRELEEEVDVTISKNKMIGYFEVVSDEPTIYQLRYAAIIDKVNPQTMDPATNTINERKFVKPNEFLITLNMKNTVQCLKKQLSGMKKIKTLYNTAYLGGGFCKKP